MIPSAREMLIKLAMQWRQEAQALRQSPQPNGSEDDGEAATHSTKRPNTTKRSQKAKDVQTVMGGIKTAVRAASS
jgi:hypothetical protein